jgi:RNA polymerase sigma factor (sigma-70 family)
MMSWLVTQRAILEAYRAGRREAWEAIYEHYYDDVRRFVTQGFSFMSQGQAIRWRGCPDLLEAEDILQEVFIRAFSEEARSSYDGLRPFKNYLLAITRNAVLQSLRRSGRLVSLPEGGAVDELPLPHPGGDPEQLLMSHELAALALRLEADLSIFHRRFFDLRFRQQLCQDEVGKRMGLSRAKVRTAERKVRQRILRFLRQHQLLADGQRPSLVQLMLGVLT